MLLNVLEIEPASMAGAHGTQDLDGETTHDARSENVTALVPLAEQEAEIGQDAASSLADRLLAALAAMAVRSKRRQADLSAALCRSGLEASSQLLGAALHELEHDGFIEHLVPLYDGGLLMTVTSRGVETLNARGRWPMLDSREFTTFYGKVA
jgi:hypothetical protein